MYGVGPACEKRTSRGDKNDASKRVQGAYPGNAAQGIELALWTGSVDPHGSRTDMRIIGLVELTQDLPPETLERLTVAAFKASRAGTVGLVLNSVSARSIDRRLDPLILTEGCRGCGVWYIEGDVPSDRLLDLAAHARFVVAVSDEFTGALDARGVAHMGSEDALLFMSGEPRSQPLKPKAPPVRRATQRGSLATI